MQSSGGAGWLTLVAILGALASGCGKKQEAPPEPYKAPPRKASTLGAYASLCSKDATPFDGAKKHERKKDPKSSSKLALFQNYVDDAKYGYRASAPEGLKPWLATDAQVDEVELVLCLDVKKKGPKLTGQCTYYGGKLEHWNMTHSLRIVEAATGKVVLKEDFDISSSTARCPATYTFTSASHFVGGDYTNKLLSLLLPFQPEGVALPEIKPFELETVCSGVPLPQTAAYDKAKPSGLFVSYRPTDLHPFTMETRPSGLPTNDAIKDAKSVALVACVTGKPAKKKQACNFLSGNVLELQEGEVEVSIYESATAKLVETKTFKASSDGCPTSYKFFDKVDPYFGKVEPQVTQYLKSLGGG